MFKLSKKAKLLTVISTAIFSISVSAVATAAWIGNSGISSTLEPTNVGTNGVTTDALVYSGNSDHTQHDNTALGPQVDEGGTYGYDHSQTGLGTSYYLMLDRDGNNTVSLTSGDNLQMFTNIYNAGDEAAYFKIILKAGDYFKLYNSDLSANEPSAWFGYDKLQEGCVNDYNRRNGNNSWPFESDGDSYHNFRVKSGAPTQAYDIYYDSLSGIWIDVHIDESSAKVTSTLSGYYIIGEGPDFSSSWNISGGHQMYIDTSNTTNYGVYQGLYLQPGDKFKIATKPDASGSWYGYSNLYSGCYAYGCFTNDGNDNIVVSKVGYFNIYLNDTPQVSIEFYSGTYTARGGSHTATRSLPRKEAITRGTTVGTKSNLTQSGFSDFTIEILNTGGLNSGDAAKWGAEFRTNSSASGNWFPLDPSQNWSSMYENTRTWASYSDVSSYDWLKIHRQDPSSSSDWNTWTISSGLKGFNYIKVRNWSNSFVSQENSSSSNSKQTKSILSVKYVKNGVLDPTVQSTITCWNKESIQTSTGWVSSPTLAGYTFGGWYTTSACSTSATTNAYIDHDATIYAKFTPACALKQSNAVDGGTYPTTVGTASISGNIVTISNATLRSGYNYYLATEGDGINISAFDNNTVMTYGTSNTSIPSWSDYFFNYSNNIGVGYGGQYDFTFNLSTRKCTAIHLDSLTKDDFKINVNGVDSTFTSKSDLVWTETNLNLEMGSVLYFKNDCTSAGASTHIFDLHGNAPDLLVTYGNYEKYFATYTAGNGDVYLKVTVDCTISFTFTFNVASTVATMAITSFTENTATGINPYINSQVLSGVYLVNSTSSYSLTGAPHMYYGANEGATCLYAYSGLQVGSTSTAYRIVDAHNTSYLHLYEHVAAQTFLDFSNNGSGYGHTGNKDDGTYFKFLTAGTFDVLVYKVNSTLEIEVKYASKTSDTSTEHQSKWCVIGKGIARASALYECDFTTFRALPLYCAKDNLLPYPCYAGQIGDNIGDALGKGNAITLIQGDKLACNADYGLLAPVADSTHLSISSNVVTVKISGLYKVYATETSFYVEFVSALDGRDTTDYQLENGDIVAPYGQTASYSKMGGARIKNADGKTLNFSSGIDLALLDAYEDGYLRVFIEFRHMNKTSHNGTLKMDISNVTAPSNTLYNANTYVNASTAVQSALANIGTLTGTNRKNNASFANGTIYSGASISHSDISYFDLATILEIKIPVASIGTITGVTGAFNLSFTITLTYMEDAA